MKRTLARVLRGGLRTLATVRALLPAARGARILTYHSVRPDGPGSRSSYVHPADFAAQMAWLVEAGYEVVSLTHLADQLSKRQPVPDRWVCITFDDGYADNYVHAFPVLKRHGLPATIFLVTGKIDQDPLFLTKAQIDEMRSCAIEFGAHTVDHVSLSSLPPEEARRQVIGSRQQVERLISEAPSHFCYPFGHYNATVEGFVRDAGFRTCCTEQAGVIHSNADPLRLVRAGILGTDSLRDFELKVRGGYDWWINVYMRLEERRRRRRGGQPA